MSQMFSNFTKFIDSMDDKVGEIVEKQHQQEQARRSSTSSSISHPHHHEHNHNTTSTISSLAPSSSQNIPATTSKVISSSPPLSRLPPPPNFSSNQPKQQQPKQGLSSTATTSTNLHLVGSNQQEEQQELEQNSSPQSVLITPEQQQQLEHDFDIALSRLKQSNSENELLHHQLESLRREHDEASSKIRSLELQLQKASEQFKSTSSSKQHLDEEHRQLQHQYENLQRENANLSSKAQLAEQSLEAALRDVEKTKSLASARILELEKSGEVEEKLAELEAEVAVLNRSLERVREDRDEWKGKYHQEVEKQNVNNLNGTGGEVSSSALDQKFEKSSRYQELINSTEDLKSQVSNLKRQHEDERIAHRATRTRYENMLSEKVEEVAILEKQLSRLSSKNNNNSSYSTKNSNNVSSLIQKAGSSSSMSSSSDLQQQQQENTTTTSDEWEKRAKDLASLVMEKQTALELQRGEADQWRAKYETTRQKLREAELMAAVSSSSSSTSKSSHKNNNNTTAVFIGGTDENNNNEETDISKNFLIANLTRKGNKTINSIVHYIRKFDIGVQLFLGGLRRNSLLRIAVAFYVFLVHMWVLILLWNAPLPVGSESQAEPSHPAMK